MSLPDLPACRAKVGTEVIDGSTSNFLKKALSTETTAAIIFSQRFWHCCVGNLYILGNSMPLKALTSESMQKIHIKVNF
jgi:hypothetical protein